MKGAGRTLSEAASKALLREFGVPLADEREVADAAGAAAAAAELGFPVAVKLCGDAIAHKTERGLVKLNLADTAAVDQRRRRIAGEGDRGRRRRVAARRADDQRQPAARSPASFTTRSSAPT